MIIHGNHLEDLRELAVNWMQRYPLAPPENEVVLVHSNGIAQWLKLALAEDPDNGGCGIAAALDVQLPARVLWQAYRSVLGGETTPESFPLDKVALSWRLMRLLPQLLSKTNFSSLQHRCAIGIYEPGLPRAPAGFVVSSRCYRRVCQLGQDIVSVVVVQIIARAHLIDFTADTVS
jgi:hypothetical protein